MYSSKFTILEIFVRSSVAFIVTTIALDKVKKSPNSPKVKPSCTKKYKKNTLKIFETHNSAHLPQITRAITRMTS